MRSYPVLLITDEHDAWLQVTSVRRITECGKYYSHSCCPLCGQRYNKERTKTGKVLTYFCGGSYKQSVNRDGHPAWVGYCGAALTQKELAYE